MKRKRIYISDIHLNDERSLYYPDTFRHYGWLNEDGIRDLFKFLQFIADDDDIDELVLLGDILDVWVCPIHLRPPTFEDILSASCNQGIIKEFNRIISHNKKLIYVPGNHDMFITNAILQKYIPGIIFIEGDNFRNRFRDKGTIAEHGNALGMFNAPDRANGINNALPVGYYISRITASKQRNDRESVQMLKLKIEHIVKNDVPDLIIKNIISSILLYCGIDEMQFIVLPNSKTISIREIKQRYSDLYSQWTTLYGKEAALKAALADLDYLEDAAIQFMKNELPHLLILGHTHIGLLEKILLPGSSLIYANTGTWCEYPQKPYSYIETEMDEKNKRQYVRLMKWVKGRPRLIKEVIL